MIGAATPLRLVSPEPETEREPLAKKPSWWLAHVESHTNQHRKGRAKVLRARGRERADEAIVVHGAIVEGYREELGLWPLSPFRELPGASPAIKKIIRHWDTQIKTASGGTRRLIRAEREPVESWCRRVMLEAERRIESTWHSQRARGQEERFRRVAKCAEDSRGVLVCKHCHEAQRDKHGNPILLSDLCGSHLLCQRCRAHRRKRYRSAFLRSRLEAVRLVRAMRLAPGLASSDPIAERFLTLTCPAIALADGGPEAQARIVRLAFRSFMNQLRNHWRERGELRLKLSRYVRVVEATTGQDERGHCHIHVYLLSPFIRAQTYRALWGRALFREFRKAGLAGAWPAHAWKTKAEVLAELLFRSYDRRAYEWAKHSLAARVPWPRIDVKRVVSRGTIATVDGLDLAVELIKYLTKDLEASTDGKGLVLMHPATFAAVYRGLDAGRMLSASKGFWVKYHAKCQCCGAQDTLRPVELLRPPAKARAPPEAFRLHSVN